MKHISQFQTADEAAVLVCNYFRGNEHLFTEALSFENVKAEAVVLNLVESVIPSNLFMEMHLDMILDKKRDALSQYYKNLAKNKNELLEKAKIALSGPNAKQLNEAIKQLKKEILSRFTVNEDNSLLGLDALDPTKALAAQIKNTLTSAAGIPTTLAQPATQTAATTQVAKTKTAVTQAASTNNVDAAIAGGEYKGKTDGTIVGSLKELWNALTEDNSPIGVLHLLLDILGVVGDFLGPELPIGLIADLLNAIIYFIRASLAKPEKSGELWLLGSISLVAAFVFGAGDALKLLKGGAKGAAPVMEAMLKNGQKGGIAELSKLSTKERGPVIRLLRFLSKNIGVAIGKAAELLGKFTTGFISKAVGWLPFIGTPLKTFFKSIGDKFTTYGEKLATFSKDFASVERWAIKSEAESVKSAVANSMKKGNYSYVKDPSGMILIKNEKGVVEAQISEDAFRKVFGDKAHGLFKNTDTDAMLLYFQKIPSSNPKLSGTIVKFFKETGWKAFKNTGRLTFFIGKQIIKLLNNGKDWQEAGYTEEEVEYYGNAAMTAWINDRIHKKKEETGAVYVPEIMLDSSEKEVFDRVTAYQNNYAKLFGEPTIIPVIYDKYGNEEVEKEFDDFWKAVKDGKIERSKDGKTTVVKESRSLFKHIIPYSKF